LSRGEKKTKKKKKKKKRSSRKENSQGKFFQKFDVANKQRKKQLNSGSYQSPNVMNCSCAATSPISAALSKATTESI
jgi:hypothetical protein